MSSKSKSTLQCIKISHSEIFEKFKCENFNEIFTPRKFHEILHLYKLPYGDVCDDNNLWIAGDVISFLCVNIVVLCGYLSA